MNARKSGKGESGQAITELMVCLVALLTVFLGVLLVSSYGADNIATMLSAREQADANAASATSSQQGESIARWDAGTDNMCLSADDIAVGGAGGSRDTFVQKLQMTQAQGQAGVEIGIDISPVPGSYSTDGRLLAAPSSESFYVSAANMVRAEASESNSLRKRELNDLSGAIGMLVGGNGQITISNSVYMPASSDTSQN